ncbi:MAG: ABC transporter substrate-binding protein [Nitrospirae bacterium]|nr:ABC transporter substrate-binding protein [Nitrospirota bacterium]
MKLTIGHLSTLYHTSILMIARPELTSDLSFEIDWRLFGTGPAIVEAFKNNQIDMAYIGLPPAIIGIAEGLDIVCIAGGHVEGTVLAAGKDSLTHKEASLCEILGQFKRIAVPGKGSIHDLILQAIVSDCKVNVTVLNMPWADEALESFVKGDADAVIGTPALAQAVITYANGQVVYPPSGLWPYNPSYGILIRRSILYDKYDEVKQFVELHERFTEILRKNPEDVADRISECMAVVDTDFVLNTIRISPCYCAALPEEYIRCTEELMKKQFDLGYIGRAVDLERVFDLSIIKEIHPERHHYK